MQFLYYVLFVLGIVGVDQISKYFTVANIALHQNVPFLPGFIGLTYVQNTGAAFSSFKGMQWLFLVVFLLQVLLWASFHSVCWVQSVSFSDKTV